MKNRTTLVAAVLFLGCASVASMSANANSWEVRREVREGARSIEMERREAAREIARCQSRKCEKRELREGRREIDRERREARHEVQHARNAYYRQPAPYYRDRDGRYDGSDRYYGSNYVGGDAHYHANGHYCRDARHLVHLRDSYYRGDRRWYRNGRYWNESDYVNRYYRVSDGRYRDNDDNDDLVKGIVIGAAVVGVIAAVHEANDND